MAKASKPKKTKESPAESAEEKIKSAAKKLFTLKGFSAVRTRDIAEEAGINLALLNYYFRSKENLYDIILMENFRQFIQGISTNVYEKNMDIWEKLERIVIAYIDFLSQNPDLPLFILNELTGNPRKIALAIDADVAPMRMHLFQEMKEAMAQGRIAQIEPFHFMANLVGLTVFPFVGKPILLRVTHSQESQFKGFMEERKKLVPIWLKAMLQPTTKKVQKS